MVTQTQLFDRRARRTRFGLRQRAHGRPRLSVFRSERHIYVQIIDDTKGETLVAASTVEKDLRGKYKKHVEAAVAVGKLAAERALAKGITKVVFDRGAYRYHGRIKALADAARAAGLTF